MITEKAIEAVTLQSAADQLKDKIRLGFAELLPPEQWRSMIEAELKAFTKPRPAQYGGGTQPSVFHEVCATVFREYVTAEVKKALAAPDFDANFWQGEVSRVVKDWLTENQESLIQTTILSLAGHAAQGLLANMQAMRAG